MGFEESYGYLVGTHARDKDGVVASMLIAEMAATYSEKGMSLYEAKEHVNDIDDRRIAYHQYYTGLTWGNASDYNLSIDCCRLGAENSANIIEQYIELTKSKRVCRS